MKPQLHIPTFCLTCRAGGTLGVDSQGPGARRWDALQGKHRKSFYFHQLMDSLIRTSPRSVPSSHKGLGSFQWSTEQNNSEWALAALPWAQVQPPAPKFSPPCNFLGLKSSTTSLEQHLESQLWTREGYLCWKNRIGARNNERLMSGRSLEVKRGNSQKSQAVKEWIPTHVGLR